MPDDPPIEAVPQLTDESCHEGTAASSAWPFFAVAGFVLLLYAAGLSRDLSRPWTGLHDWNGALFSQLARNLNRYPMDIHHGLPLVAAGAEIPEPSDRSLYVSHPPGIVWLIAGAFRLTGEAEWAARLVPICASLVCWIMLVRLMLRRRGCEAAMLAGVLYALLPMSVYFGRMVNHEPICLMFMLLALEGWSGLGKCAGRAARPGSAALWLASLVMATWIDWPGALFAGLFCIFAMVHAFRGRCSRGLAIAACVVNAASLLGLLRYLVYGALGGRWGDLWAIYTDRARTAPQSLGASPLWHHVVDNLTWPILILAAVGIIFEAAAFMGRRHSGIAGAKGQPQGSAMGILTLTGLAWVALFPRQFEIHPYWMFYLGPWFASEAGYAIAGIARAIRPRVPRAATILAGALTTTAAGYCLVGQDYYFCQLPPRGDVARINDLIDMSRSVQNETQPDETILLFRDPWRGERHGSYEARYMIPPQLMYYMDRRIAVEPRPSNALQWRDRCRKYVISLDDLAAAADREQARSALGSLPVEQVGPYVVFDLAEAPTTSGSTRPNGI